MERLEENKATYRRFIDLLNSQKFDDLPEVVDPSTYREICVGATPGWVDYEQAVVSVRGIVESMNDVTVHLEDMVAEGDKVFARATVTGTNTGSLMGMPPTNKSFQAHMFDYVKIDGGRIVERIQMADNMGMMQQLMGGMPGMGGAPPG
jgi:predicted ester cyclase